MLFSFSIVYSPILIHYTALLYHPPVLDYVGVPVGPEEDKDEDQLPEKLKSSVHAFLQQNMKVM